MTRPAAAPRARRRRPALPRVPSKLEAQFILAWKLLRPAGMPLPVAEFRFDAARKWRFDFAFFHGNVLADCQNPNTPVYSIHEPSGVAVELEGGTWQRKSRHTSGRGYQADLDKYNAAALAGWTVLRFTAADLKRPQSVVDTVAAALRLRGWA